MFDIHAWKDTTPATHPTKRVRTDRRITADRALDLHAPNDTPKRHHMSTGRPRHIGTYGASNGSRAGASANKRTSPLLRAA